MSCFHHRGPSGKSEAMKSDESSDMRHFQKDDRLIWPHLQSYCLNVNGHTRCGGVTLRYYNMLALFIFPLLA